MAFSFQEMHYFFFKKKEIKVLVLAPVKCFV